MSLSTYLDFYENFRGLKSSVTKKWSDNIFQKLKPFLESAITKIIYDRKKLNRGPKIKEGMVSAALEALFESVDNGSKIKYLERHHLSRGSYYRYLHIIIDYQLLELFHKNLIKDTVAPHALYTDATHIGSTQGSEMVGYGYKEKSKKAIKITILIGMNKVIYLSAIHPDNLNDHTAFEDIALNNPVTDPVDVYADAGYNGVHFKATCISNGYNVISVPRIKKGKPSHVLSNYHAAVLSRSRARVEHVNAQLKIFRGIRTKTNRQIKFYNCSLNLANLLVSIHNGIIRGGLRHNKKHPLKLVPKKQAKIIIALRRKPKHTFKLVPKDKTTIKIV